MQTTFVVSLVWVAATAATWFYGLPIRVAGVRTVVAICAITANISVLAYVLSSRSPAWEATSTATAIIAVVSIFYIRMQLSTLKKRCREARGHLCYGCGYANVGLQRCPECGRAPHRSDQRRWLSSFDLQAVGIATNSARDIGLASLVVASAAIVVVMGSVWALVGMVANEIWQMATNTVVGVMLVAALSYASPDARHVRAPGRS